MTEESDTQNTQNTQNITIEGNYLTVKTPEFVEIWGPCCWKLLHSIAWTFPEFPTEEEKQNHIDFFISLSKVLPCLYCRKHFQEWISINPINCNSINEIANWVWKLHNHINLKNNKPEISYEDAFEKYHKISRISPWNPK